VALGAAGPELRQELHRARQTEGWSLRQAGRQIGIDWTYLRMLERGERCPSRSVAAALIEALELPPDIALWLRELAVPNAGRSEPEADADESQPPA
jgi:transcriptional regulator with XRE-family HTH domain